MTLIRSNPFERWQIRPWDRNLPESDPYAWPPLKKFRDILDEWGEAEASPVTITRELKNAFSQSVKATQNETSVSYSFDIPGVSKDSVEASIENNTLSVVAEENGRSYKYQVAISRDVDANTAQATIENGVLTVMLQKKEATKTVKILIKKA